MSSFWAIVCYSVELRCQGLGWNLRYAVQVWKGYVVKDVTKACRGVYMIAGTREGDRETGERGKPALWRL